MISGFVVVHMTRLHSFVVTELRARTRDPTVPHKPTLRSTNSEFPMMTYAKAHSASAQKAADVLK